MRRALLSVFDKSGLLDFARGLVELGFELVSTGGTRRALAGEGLPVTAVADVTGLPEMLDGRVKTLHPALHAGILADRDRATHRAALEEHAFTGIDLVAVNLYPFREAAAAPESSEAEIVEMIDIGGPAMVRSAAKNHRHVAVVVDPADYPRLLRTLAESDAEGAGALRAELAAKAFALTAGYDAAIARWLANQSADATRRAEGRTPERLDLALERVLVPRYGENPHQKAGVYRTVAGEGIFGGLTQHQGKELSYNNLLDADAARRLVSRFAEPVAAIVKHNNPCGVGRGDSPAAAYRRALACDPTSAFGSIVAVNRPADADLAEAMADLFVEVVLAPAYDEGALAIFSRKKNLRVLECGVDPSGELELRSIDGGFLVQEPDIAADSSADWRCATERRPDEVELRALELAWRVARQVRSNAIVVANERQTVGIGAGQMSRVDSCRIAIDKAELPLAGTAAASDAFFPFADGLETLAEAGVTALVQPGGSKRDAEVIAAADARGVAMMLTGRRHFRH